MGRIRLQIQVMPWAQGLGPSTSQTRRGEVDKFCQPCDEESTIQELADEVYARWERVNPGIEWVLNQPYGRRQTDVVCDQSD